MALNKLIRIHEENGKSGSSVLGRLNELVLDGSIGLADHLTQCRFIKARK